MTARFLQNPLIRTQDITPSRSDFVVECVMNPGAFKFKDKTWLLLRVSERKTQKNGKVSLPIMDNNGEIQSLEFNTDDPHLDISDPRKYSYNDTIYLTTISHLRLVCSADGIHFYEPEGYQSKIFGKGYLETYGIEDSRVAHIDGTFYLTYTEVSENGVGVGLISTKNWIDYNRLGMILPPHNKDCALFEEKIGGMYYCLHRPSGVGFGGNFIWLANSDNLTHWGGHHCILKTRKGMWDSDRVGAGTSPIKTKDGWLAIYHGANHENRYCLGAVLLDLKDPTIILARSQKPIMEPTEEYEKKGFFGNVIFTNGHIVNGDKITMYYGASDEVICAAELSIDEILTDLKVLA